MAYDDTGGIPVEPDATLTSLVTGPGQVRYGDTLLGSATPAGLRQLIGWRDLPDMDVSDSPRPQAHGTYPGAVLGGSLTVTGVFLLRGTPARKALALAAIEKATRPDGVERWLIVNDGTGATYRMGRTVARSLPQDKHFNHAPVEVSIQWVCADPRRYDLTERTGVAALPAVAAGMDYPVTYPLEYGTAASTALAAGNDGSTDSPLVATFTGPLENPRLASTTWAMAFDLTLAAGEQLVVDTAEGTALLDGTADRLYAIRSTSDPLEVCTIPPGGTTLTLTAAGGTGYASVTHRDARL